MKVFLFFMIEKYISSLEKEGTETFKIGNTKIFFKAIDESNVVCFAGLEIDIPYVDLREKIEEKVGKPIKIWTFYSHLPDNKEYRSDKISQLNSIDLDGIFQLLFKKKKPKEALKELEERIGPSSKMDPLIIICTLDITPYEEWRKAAQKEGIGRHYNQEIEEGKTGEDNIKLIEFTVGNYTVLFVRENGYESSGCDKILENILKNQRWNSIEGKYMAVHHIALYIKGLAKIEKDVTAICNFRHDDIGPNKEFWDLILKFLDNIGKGESKIAKAEQICGEIIIKIGELGASKIDEITNIKHRIAHLFLAIDIDLQEWRNRNFDQEYGVEIQKAYNGKATKALQQARGIIYSDKKCSLKNIYKDNIAQNKAKLRQNIEDAWQELRNQMPENQNTPTNIYDILEKLDFNDKARLEKLKIILSDKNHFNEWFLKLDGSLDKLRSLLMEDMAG